jgi:hypothetical protein
MGAVGEQVIDRGGYFGKPRDIVSVVVEEA